MLNPKRMAVTAGNREAFLTPREFRILQLLARHSGNALSANEIIVVVWGEEHRDEVAIPVCVCRIRDNRGPDSVGEGRGFHAGRGGEAPVAGIFSASSKDAPRVEDDF